MSHPRHVLLGCALLLAAIRPSAAQTVQQLLSAGDPFLGSTIERFHDVAAGDGGEWFAAVSVSPSQGTPLIVIHGAPGADGAFTPGPVAALPGAIAHLVNEPARGDYLQSGTTVTVTNVIHGLLPGEQVRLDFRTASVGAPPADGFFTVQSVLDSSAFTVVHGTAGSCGTVLAPCGVVDLVRTLQPVNLGYSRACLPAYQGVMQMTDDDVPGTPPVITPTRADGGVFWNSTLLLREGALSSAPQVGAGTIYTRIVRSVVDSRQDFLVLARMDDPGVDGVEDALVALDVSPACPPALLSERVLVRTGDALQNVGNRRFRGFLAFDERSFALNERGDFMYVATLTETSGLPATDSPVVVNDRAVLFAFQQVPGGTGPMVHFPMVTLDLDDLGDYVVQVKVQEGAPPNNAEYGEAIVKGHVNGVNPRKFVQSGDPMPDPSVATGEILLKVGRRLEVTDPLRAFPVLLTNGGDVVWYGEWGHVDGSGAEITVGKGIFFNHKVIVRVGQTLATADDVLVEIGVSPSEVRSALAISPNGRSLCFTGIRGKLSDSSYRSEALFRVDLGESVPYGTVIQSTGGGRCTYPYPPATLDCIAGLPLPGSTALGDFPLLGHQIHAVATSAPAGTVTALFRFTILPPNRFPCGGFRSGFPFEVLFGPGLGLNHVVGYSGSAVVSQLFPASPALLGSAWYGQAFFKDATGTAVGATNGIRYVIGAQ